jgi:hypothetical protein
MFKKFKSCKILIISLILISIDNKVLICADLKPKKGSGNTASTKFLSDVKDDFTNDSDFQNLLKTAASNGAEADEVKQIKDIAQQKISDVADTDGIDQNSDTYKQAINDINSTIDKTLKVDPKTGAASQQTSSEWASAKKYFGEGVGALGTGLTLYQGYQTVKEFTSGKSKKGAKVNKESDGKEQKTKKNSSKNNEENEIKQKEKSMENKASIEASEKNLEKEQSSKFGSEEENNDFEHEHDAIEV